MANLESSRYNSLGSLSSQMEYVAGWKGPLN